jgi:hypothetical protein
MKRNSIVIPGHCAAMSPEPMNTGGCRLAPMHGASSSAAVFMGSGLGPAGRPGMTMERLP